MYRPSPLDDTHSLLPPRRAEPAARRQPEAPAAKDRPAPPPPLTRAEKSVRFLLLLGLALTAAVLLTLGTTLTLADLLLGATVLAAGLTLLVVMEISRGASPPPGDG